MFNLNVCGKKINFIDGKVCKCTLYYLTFLYIYIQSIKINICTLVYIILHDCLVSYFKLILHTNKKKMFYRQYFSFWKTRVLKTDKRHTVVKNKTRDIKRMVKIFFLQTKVFKPACYIM